MATIVATVTSGLHPTVGPKTYTLPDSELDRLVTAYQSDANVSVNGTATYAQVMLYVLNTVLIAALVAKTAQMELAAAHTAVVTPTPIKPV